MDSSSSRSSSEASNISLFLNVPSSLSSISFLSDSGRSAQRNPLGDLKALLDLLYHNEVPGPYLIRVKQEFNLCTGEGGEGTIYEASSDFARKLSLLAAKAPTGWGNRIRQSAKHWRTCVIKQLRSDGERPLAFQTNSAKTEINVLSNHHFLRHPHLVTLLGWALCLDSLENPASSAPRLPLLVLEKSQYDLKSFLNSADYGITSHEDLCAICLGIGRGLQALHEDKISHGDLKPANVLIFERDTSDRNLLVSAGAWVAKLCDFGLATTYAETRRTSGAVRYKGTVGWKPPETYTDLSLETFQFCDIFSYGLVVWCIFIGVPASPIWARGNQDEESATIIANLGQQIFYRTASQSIRRAYDLVQGGLHLVLSEVVDLTLNVGPGPKRPFRTRRKAYLSKSTELRDMEINRALTVLRESLNDDPARRHPQPWIFMDIEGIETLGSVQDPEQYTTNTTTLETTTGRAFYDTLMQLCSINLHRFYEWRDTIVRRAKHTVSQRKRHIALSLMGFISAWLPWLLPQNPRQQVYDHIFSVFEATCRDKKASETDTMLYSLDAGGMEAFEHGHGHDSDACHSLLYLYTLLQDALTAADRHSSQDYILYSFARIRSRVKLCCWRNYAQNPVFADRTSASNLSPADLAMEQETLLFTYLSCGKDFETLTWLCRGEVAAVVFQEMQADAVGLWGWIGVHDADSRRLTAKMTLLLERGCNIGQQFWSAENERSPFRWYLETLRVTERSLALKVCRQFRRIAADEGANKFAQFYLTGQSPDLRDDEPIDELEFKSTALHDAVMASNYDVVEYLVRTDFIVNVRDVFGRTPLQLAESLTAHLSNNRNKGRQIRNNQMIALLRQSKSTSYRHCAEALPVGWAEIKPDEPPIPGATHERFQEDSSNPLTDDQVQDDVPPAIPSDVLAATKTADVIAHKDPVTAETEHDRPEPIVRPQQTPAALDSPDDGNHNNPDIVYESKPVATGSLAHESDNGPNEDYNARKFLDLDKPLLPQVWNRNFSKAFYLQQVYRPRYYAGGGAATLFGNFWEPLTKGRWWIMPLLWLPPVIYGTYLSWAMLPWAETATYWLLGYLIWALIEYVVHRFVFHCDDLLPDHRLAFTVHFLIHGLHHFLPMDEQRVVRPPALALFLAIPLYSLVHHIFFWDWYVATAVTSGATFGYICFEITHHCLHHKRHPWLPRHPGLKKNHMQHHYANHENGFGVTTFF